MKFGPNASMMKDLEELVDQRVKTEKVVVEAKRLSTNLENILRDAHKRLSDIDKIERIIKEKTWSIHLPLW